MNIIDVPSPNFITGRKNHRPEAVVIHIMEGTLHGTDSWFSSIQSKVSAHYGIGKNGEVHRYVQETNTAWHAGRVNAPSWTLIKKSPSGMFVNPNYYTIGIEHEGNEQSEWTELMYKSSAEMVRDICQRWNIPIDRSHIIGHHEIYSLKTCPGFKVDLNKLIALATGVQPPAVPAPQIIKTRTAGNGIARVRLNIRSGPGRNFSSINVVDPGIQLAFDGFTEQGEVINGTGKWFFTDNDNWFWSGGIK